MSMVSEEGNPFQFPPSLSPLFAAAPTPFFSLFRFERGGTGHSSVHAKGLVLQLVYSPPPRARFSRNDVTKGKVGKFLVVV